MKNTTYLILFPLLVALAWLPQVDFSVWGAVSTQAIIANKSEVVKRSILLEEPARISLDQMGDWLQQTLQTNEHTRFKLTNSFSDKQGFTHYKYHQTYQGHQVQDGIVIVHQKGEEVISLNYEYYPGITVDPVVEISPTEAIRIGKQTIDAEIWAKEHADAVDVDTYIILTNTGYHCAYKVDVFAYQPMIRKWLFIDVQTGVVVAERDRISHFSVPGEAHCYYHGIQTIIVDSLGPSEFLLRDDSRADGIITRDLNGSPDLGDAVDFVDDDNVWDTTMDLDNAALDVHWASGQMYDYMLNVHGWNSYDNGGAAIYNYIHHSNNFNALWNGSGMVFGDGNGESFTPFTAAEVVGHEFMHAYSTSIVDWNLSNLDTRTINESISDIFSVIVEYNTSPTTANYLIGDMISTSGSALRNMEDPNSIDHPDTYEGEFWSTFNISVNADVLNHFFFLLTQGGAGTNDNGGGFVVEAIPLAEVADILFRAMSVYMTPSTDYTDVRNHGIQACRDLFGPCSEQERQFTNAFYAIGVGAAYTGPPQTQIQVTGQPLLEEEFGFSSNTMDAINWDWNFGDNMNSTEEMPVHIYQSAGTFEVILAAAYAGGCVLSDTISVTVENSTGLAEITSEEVEVYPNPVQQMLFVGHPEGGRLKDVRLLNTLGQVFNNLSYQRVSNSKYKLDIGDMPSGIYWLILEFENQGTVVEKIYFN